VVEEVMCHIITDISKYATTENCDRSVPVIEENCVSQFPEGRGQNHEQSWWHHKPVFIHWQIMVDSVKKEMEGDADSIIREISEEGQNVR
jgi:hypothetical protein